MKSLLVLFILVLAGGVYWHQREDIRPQSEADMAAVAAAEESRLAVIGSDVNYYEDVTGYFVRPTNEGVYPGVVMIHEWWGLNDNIKHMAEELAAEGYAVLAVDLHHGEVATTSERARELTGNLDQDEAIENLRAATAYVRSQGVEKIASLGWCFGGGQSMQLSLSGEPLDATVIYYGSLVTDEQKLKTINWPVLGIFGEEDPVVPVDSVQSFETALSNVGVEHSINLYPGVGHAFANPSGDGYAPEETADAWQKTLAFLNENLR